MILDSIVELIGVIGENKNLTLNKEIVDYVIVVASSVIDRNDEITFSEGELVTRTTR